MKVHFIGIGGVGMAGLAVLLKNRGHEVSGCDLQPTPRTRWLESEGVSVAFGHDPRHMAGADEAIVTPAVAADNPEFVAAGARTGLRVRRRGEVLAELVSSAVDSIAVCGSHGKTTTSTFVARLLLALGESVEWAIGGETGEFPVAGRVCRDGRLPVLVVEADESDGTLARYRAKTLVVTNCEYDHPDHFPTPTDYFACFDAARRGAATVVEAESLDAPTAEDFAFLAELPAHNRRNAVAAIEVARRRGHGLTAIAAALKTIVRQLPDRRFQRVWPMNDATAETAAVYTDYAHHPAEMRCAVEMARHVCRGRLVVLFQPHRFSRTKSLLADFPSAFAGADEVVICPVYAAFEPPVEGGSDADLYAECRRREADCGFGNVYLARSCEEAWEHALRTASAPGDVTLLLGAGDIVRLIDRVRADCASPCERSPRRIWIGQGTNTWKSDLKLNVEYVRTTGRADGPGAALGIPWMAGVPGTVGGWIKMNAGAFGHSISEVLSRVKVDGVWRSADECGFGYRHSEIDGEIQDYELKPDALRDEGSAADYLARRPRFPAGTKGSVFKNPPGDSAGRLLEAADCKGLRVGGAYVWERHANVIVSEEGARASDFLALAQLMRIRVRLRFGVDLQPEVTGLV